MNGVVFLFSLCFMGIKCVHKYRFDYTYDEKSKGWFKVHITPATWNDARFHCEKEGGALASPTNAKMLKAMVSRIKKLENEETIYTGVSSNYYNGHYYSIEGFSLIRMDLPWMPNEPNNYKNNENCIILTKSGSIADINCMEVFPFMCFKKVDSTLLLNQCGTVDSEYKLLPSTGNCYKFHTIARNWSMAYMTCSAEGGYLAIPNSIEEADYYLKLHKENAPRSAITTKYTKEFFVGFLNVDRDSYFVTVHGDQIEKVYDRWADGEPNNYRGNQYCGAMHAEGTTRRGKLDDMWCDTISVFICEKDPKSLI